MTQTLTKSSGAPFFFLAKSVLRDYVSFMKIILISALTLLSSINSFAQDNLQFISCSFMDPSMNDRVIVNVYSDLKSGTFFYSTGLDTQGDDVRTPALKLSRLVDQGAQAQFKASFSGVVNHQNTSVEFQFAMPKAELFKSSNYFVANVTTDMGFSGSMSCYSRIYPKN